MPKTVWSKYMRQMPCGISSFLLEENILLLPLIETLLKYSSPHNHLRGYLKVWEVEEELQICDLKLN
jgi:hypothetical protein